MSPARRLVAYALPYRRSFVLGLICVVATASIALTGPRVLQYAVDDVSARLSSSSLSSGTLVGYSALLIAIGITGGLFRFLMRRILIGASRHIEYDIRNDFFAHLETLPLSYYHTHHTGDLMSRATNDLNAVRMMVGPAVMYSASTLLTFVAALALMLSIDPWLTMCSLIPLPIVSICVKYFGSAIHRRFEQIQAQLSELSAVTQEALAGVRVVRAYRQEAAELARFRAANEEYLRRNRRLIVLQGLFFPTMAFFLGLGAMLVLWLGSRQVINGRISLGEFVAFNLYLTMLSWPMIAFGWVTNMLQRGMASWKRMLEVLDTDPAAAGGSKTDAPCRAAPSSRDGSGLRVPLSGAIELRHLTFSYNGTPVLKDVSARIESGQTVALVGPTGAGKSTLVSLLVRLHDPPPGTVFIDGIDVRDLSLDALRGALGVAPQEAFLFSDTLANNVAFGLDAITDRREHEDRRAIDAPPAALAPSDARDDRQARIRAAAAAARLDKDIADFPNGYETTVGERGITLSGGQKQRTALARAIALDPRILVLDDALSAVDTQTEEEILTRLRDVMRERTSIIVSHRISTVRDADRIFVLDKGHIVEQGSHDELVDGEGLYAELHRKQLLEDELAAS
jgi:ATP-binding cassette subfamily B protein